MFKKLTLIGIATFTFSNVFAQSNNAYVELGGAAVAMSFNYERMLTDNILARAGYGSGTDDVTGDKMSFIPLGASYLLGSGNHKLEFGGGMTMISGTFDIGDEEEAEASANMTFIGGGYRYQRGTGGLLLSLKAYNLMIGGFSLPWAGLSLGWTF
jgi:hypothetical protein